MLALNLTRLCIPLPLSQTSTFGAFFDVVLDNATRGILWCLALPYGLGSLFLVGYLVGLIMVDSLLILVPFLVGYLVGIHY